MAFPARLLGFGALAIVGGAAAGSFVVSWMDSAKSPVETQLNALEQRVGVLQERLQTEALEQAALEPRPAGEVTPDFHVECPTAWRELGPIGQGLWGCQTPEPLPDGFHPNCNLTSSRVEGGTTPRAYYERASGPGSALGAARKLGGREVTLHEPAYEASFEHNLTSKPIRVLVTLFVHAERAFALTCSTPPELFETYAPQFRAIAQSLMLR